MDFVGRLYLPKGILGMNSLIDSAPYLDDSKTGQLDKATPTEILAGFGGFNGANLNLPRVYNRDKQSQNLENSFPNHYPDINK